MAGSVATEGWDPGEKVEVYPAYDLVPRGRPVKTVSATKQGRVQVSGLKPGNYFLDAAGQRRRVQIHVPEATYVEPEAELLSPEEIRERLAQTRPEGPGDERTVQGARTTANRPKRQTSTKRATTSTRSAKRAPAKRK